MTWNSTTQETWQQWTPTITSTGTANTPFNPVATSNRYKVAGSLVIARFQLDVTNPGGTGFWRLSLPVPPKQVTDFTACGDVYMWANSRSIFGSVVLHTTSHTTSTVEFVPFVPWVNVGTTLPRFPQGAITTEYLHISGRIFYEAA